MAHFAEIDSNNIVLRVLVVDNNDLLDSENNESEALGITYLSDAFGGNWKQTSYNNNFRKNYAGIGYTFDSSKDAFIAPKPYTSWTLNNTTCKWEAPVAFPTDGKNYKWDESITNWKEIV